MPLFFYSQLKTAVYDQKELDKKKINQSVKDTHVVMTAEELKKLTAFQASIEELYHLFNQDYNKPATSLNNTLHDLSVQASNKIAGTQQVDASLDLRNLQDLKNTLAFHKINNHLMLKSIGEGVLAALSLTFALSMIAALPLLMTAGTATFSLGLSCVLLAPLMGWGSLCSGELSYHTYKLSQDQQLNHINNFFSSSDSLEKIEQEQSNTPVDLSSLLASTMQ